MPRPKQSLLRRHGTLSKEPAGPPCGRIRSDRHIIACVGSNGLCSPRHPRTDASRESYVDDSRNSPDVVNHDHCPTAIAHRRNSPHSNFHRHLSSVPKLVSQSKVAAGRRSTSGKCATTIGKCATSPSPTTRRKLTTQWAKYRRSHDSQLLPTDAWTSPLHSSRKRLLQGNSQTQMPSRKRGRYILLANVSA